MDRRDNEMTGTGGLPEQQELNRQAFLRYLPRRIADFERRIVRYRFAGWDPNGMVVLAGDVRRLADASANYGLDHTREPLLTLAQMVSGCASSMRMPDPKQTQTLFSLLAAVIKSLPAMESVRAAVAAESPAATDDRRTPVDEPLTHSTAADAGDGGPSDTPAAAQDPADGSRVPTEAVAVGAATEIPDSEGEPAEVQVDATPQPAGIEPVEAAASSDAVATDESGDAPSAAAMEAVDAAAAPEATSDTAAPDAAVALPAPSREDDTTASTSLTECAAESVAPPEALQPESTPDPVSAAAPIEPAQTAPVDHSAAASTATRDADPVADPVADLRAFDETEEHDVAGGAGMLRVFHLSDGNALATGIGQRLEAEGYAIESVDGVDELSELLTCMMPHMLLVDASHISRLAIIGALRRDAQQRSQPPRHIQMVVIAEQDGMEVRRSAHRAGADLVLFPPHDAGGVARRLKALHAAADVEPVRVLVVDDERADALFAQAVLNRAGMHARVEHDPMRVIEALSAERADLILMDLHMPFANGVEVTMLLRDDPQFARIPIVFLSGESDPDSRLEAINAGGDDFLFKPIRPRHLVAAVQDRVRRLHAIEKPEPATGA